MNIYMNFGSIIIGGIEDQVEALLQGWWREPFINLLNAPFGFHFVNPWKTNQPIFSFIFTEGVKIVNPVIFSNIFAIFSIILTAVLSFILFRALKFVWFLSLVLALIFAFSPYVFMHIGIHPALSQIWLIPLVFQRTLLKKGESFAKGYTFFSAAVTGFILAMSVLISNYLGFFLILCTFCFFVADLVCSGVICRALNFWRVLCRKGYYYMLTLLFCALFSGPFLLPYIKANYLGQNTNLALEGISSVRTLEDFQNFSARPWYFILPPLAHPILGPAITGPVLDWMKNDWGYFLADDYFPKEHGGDYLGWANVLIFVTALYYAAKQVFVKIKSQRSQPKAGRPLAEKVKIESLPAQAGRKLKVYYSEFNLELVITLTLTALLLFLFTFPPFFTISGHKIYTLGFVLYKFFPMFRVTARIGEVMLMCILIVNGVFLSHLGGVRRLKLVILAYLLFTLFEFYVPVSTFDTSKVPPVYEYLSKVNRELSFNFIGSNGKGGQYTGPLIIAEYPGGRAEDIFWITVHHKGLINPRTYENSEFGFDAEVFTKNLATERGLAEAERYGVSYIVFHKTRAPKNNEESFFREHLGVVGIFGDDILFKF